MTDSTKGPFRQAVADVYDGSAWGFTWHDMEMLSKKARSASWWNKVYNGVAVSPPPIELIPRIANMLGFPSEAVAEMVAAQWYGVTKADVSERVARLAPILDSVSEETIAALQAALRYMADVAERERSCTCHKDADGDEPGQDETGDLQGDD